MKKILLINVVIVILFWLTGPFYDACSGYGPGAKIVLGLALNWVVSYNVCAVICSCTYSLFSCIKKRDFKMLVPIIVLVLGYGFYFILGNGESFWYRVIKYFV